MNDGIEMEYCSSYLDYYSIKIVRIIQKNIMTNHIMVLMVPPFVDIRQFNNVQRGIIFMWFLTVFVILIITGLRLFMGQLDPLGASYEESKEEKDKEKETTMEGF
jgi:hypothetical protein